LEDLADYLNLIGDNSLDMELRTKVGELIVESFDENDVEIWHQWCNMCSPSDWVEKLLEIKELHAIHLVKIWEEQELMQQPDGSYRGLLGFEQECTPCRGGMRYVVEIHVRKIQKDFVYQQAEIWELFLGTISPLP